MMSLIDVQCPHCGARGQIMLPPVGSMIIGPCPQCKELVVIFCGHVLPLSKETMLNSTLEDRREHLMQVLTDFLRDRVSKLISDDAPAAEEESLSAQFDSIAEVSEFNEDEANDSGSLPAVKPGPITESEQARFTSVDLKLLDNEAYFKSVFDDE